METYTFYATFGVGHAYSGCYVEIFADSHHAARAHMIREHGERWSGEAYTAARFAGMAERYGLIKLVSVRQRPGYPTQSAIFDVCREPR